MDLRRGFFLIVSISALIACTLVGLSVLVRSM